MTKPKSGKYARRHSAHSESDRKYIDYTNFVQSKQKEFMREGQEVEGE